MSQQPLKELKVLELAGVLAGPAVGMFFAELGAEVIKVENPHTGGDVTRHWKLAAEDPGSPLSAYYASANWNKHVLFHDLKSAQGRAAVLELAQHSDIVICNFKAGDAEKLGLDPAALQRLNPRLLIGIISGFGSEVPRSAFDLVLQAETGFMSMNGTPESGPLKMPLAMIDLLAAHQLKEGLLLALMQRAQTGLGAVVEVSLYEAALASLANQASNYLMAGQIPARTGSLHPNIAPYGEMFACADGKEIVLAVGGDKQFATMCRILGEPQLADDARWSVNTARVKNRDSLREMLAPLFRKKNAADWLDEFISLDVPAGIVRSLDEVFGQQQAGRMVLRSREQDRDTARVRTAAFEIRPFKK